MVIRHKATVKQLNSVYVWRDFFFSLLQKLRMSPLNEPKSTVVSALILPEGGKRFSFQNTETHFLILVNYMIDQVGRLAQSV